MKSFKQYHDMREATAAAPAAGAPAQPQAGAAPAAQAPAQPQAQAKPDPMVGQLQGLMKDPRLAKLQKELQAVIGALGQPLQAQAGAAGQVGVAKPAGQ